MQTNQRHVHTCTFSISLSHCPFSHSIWLTFALFLSSTDTHAHIRTYTYKCTHRQAHQHTHKNTKLLINEIRDVDPNYLTSIWWAFPTATETTWPFQITITVILIVCWNGKGLKVCLEISPMLRHVTAPYLPLTRLHVWWPWRVASPTLWNSLLIIVFNAGSIS